MTSSSDKLHNISFKVRKGEVLGLGGLVGSGRSETAMSILGYLPIDRGQVFIEGKEIKRISPSEIIKNGIGLICEDRKRLSLFQGSSVKFNFSILTIKEYCDWIVVNKKKELDAVNAYKEAINIKTSSLDEAVADLSGGNQQKVVISRWLASNMKVLIFDEPTQGIDVGARFEIYKIINDLAARGMAIIMISSDMSELLGMSDRILVYSEGRISGELQKEEFSQDLVLQYASKAVKPL